MQPGDPCPACASAYTLRVQEVMGRRGHKRYQQWYCMDCGTLFHRSGFIPDADEKRLDFDALTLQHDNHASIMSQLVLELRTRVPTTRTVLEIGHGTGLFLKACGDYGIKAHGMELNELCHRHAVEVHGVSSELGTLDDSHQHSYDLIVAIQVFEHLEAPRPLFEQMRKHLNRDGAIYISVPFMMREQWPYLWTADTNPGAGLPDPFFDNDIHITHFTVDGMRQMGLSLGARSATYFVSTDTYQKSPGAYQGVLFTF